MTRLELINKRRKVQEEIEFLKKEQYDDKYKGEKGIEIRKKINRLLFHYRVINQKLKN